MEITPPAIVMDVTAGTVDIVETPAELNAAVRQSRPPTILRILDVHGGEFRLEVAATHTIQGGRKPADKGEVQRLLIGLGAYYGAFDTSTLTRPSLGIEELFRSYYSECRLKRCIPAP
jgi:hypothetical protein